MNRPAQLELVGRKIRQLRRQRKLTQVELAEKIGIHQSDLSRMEQGEYKVGLDTLLKILQCFDLSIGDFFDENNRANTVIEKYKALSATAQKEVESFIDFKRRQESDDAWDDESGESGGKMLSPIMNDRIENLRQRALAHVRAGEYEDALSLYDEALALSPNDESRELLTINKADVMIALERTGPEVQALPTILMRRRNLHHTFLAAYALMFKHRIQSETKRAIFYGHVALDASKEADEPFWKIAALNDLGIIYEIDSQFEEAIHCFEQALPLLEVIESPTERTVSHTAIMQNLGYNKLLIGQTREGIGTILSILDSVESPSARAESYIDLCYGYLELGQHDKARFYGEAGLSLASESRQVRNAHYLLGEACYKSGDADAAEFHFDELSKFYPQFRNLKSLLFAIDLRGMVNLKL